MDKFSSFEDNFNPVVATNSGKTRNVGGGDASSPGSNDNPGSIRLPPPSQGFGKSLANSVVQNNFKNGRHDAVRQQVSLPGPPSIIDKGDQGAAAAAAASAAAAAAALASPGTRVYKKSSPNGKITIYIGKRDFIDHGTYVDPIDGVVLVDPEYMTSQPGTRVWVHVLAAFRYGREDLDVLGLTFRKDLFLAHQQIFPVPKGSDNAITTTIATSGGGGDTAAASGGERRNNDRPLTKLQERLLKKLGQHAFPFFFELPAGTTPASVTLQPAPGDTGKPCGVDYELKAYVAPAAEDKPHKRDVIRLAIRKLYYAPPETVEREQPSCEVSKDFVMSPGRLHLECTLDKEMYYHGESIAINVQITNNSTKTVKKIKASVIQLADICLFSAARYKCPVAELESEHGFPVGPGFTLSKVYWLTPLLANNREKRGLALDGKLKHEDTNLASSTPLPKNATVEDKENLGIVVSYRVRVKLIIGGLGAGDLVSELAFTLTHPKPKPEVDDGKLTMQDETDSKEIAGDAGKLHAEGTNNGGGGGACQPEVDLNLIELDTADTPAYADQNEDLIFEDFARLRLTGNQPTQPVSNGNNNKQHMVIDPAANVLVPNYAAAAVAGNSNGLSLSPSSIDPFNDLHNQQHAASSSSFVSTQQPQLTLSSNNPFLDDFIASAPPTQQQPQHLPSSS